MEPDTVNDDSLGWSEPLITGRNPRRGPPVGRHVAAVAVVVLLILLFFWSNNRENGFVDRGPLRLSNLVLADTSLVLLCLILILGAVARFVPRLRPVVPWARELGIGMLVTGGLHVVLLVSEWDWDVYVFFGYQSSPVGTEFGTRMWDAANWVGLLALGYALVLAATSNDLSQRWLGRGWKFVQRQAYTLFVLVWLHTAAFVLLDAGHGSSFMPWFWAFTLIAIVAQFAGFVHTVRSTRGPSPQRAPAKSGDPTSTSGAVAIRKGVAVTALWGIVVSVTLFVGL